MKPLFLFIPSAAAALLAATAFIVTTAAQAPQGPQSGDGNPPPPSSFPAPTNLKVLPKDLTGQQVHDIMERWEASLGTRCNSCHAEDRNNLGPNGRPQLNFADDSKPVKAVAHTMYSMTEEINPGFPFCLSGDERIHS